MGIAAVFHTVFSSVLIDIETAMACTQSSNSLVALKPMENISKSKSKELKYYMFRDRVHWREG